MNKESLQSFLHTSIPLTQSMGVEIVTLTPEEVTLLAPLHANRNHKQTAFGGSLHAVTTLTCWCLLKSMIQDESYELVISHSDVNYVRPVTSDILATAKPPPKEKWSRFEKTLKMKQKGKINLEAVILQDGEVAVRFQGTFAAIKPSLSIV